MKIVLLCPHIKMGLAELVESFGSVIASDFATSSAVVVGTVSVSAEGIESVRGGDVVTSSTIGSSCVITSAVTAEISSLMV